MLNELDVADKTVGLKQSIKKIRSGEAKKVFLAKDASPNLTDEIVRSCEEFNIPLEWVPLMEDLGRACNIDVGAAVVAVY